MTIGFRFDIARGIDTLPPEVGRGRTHTREAGGGIRGICRSRTISGLSEKFCGAKKFIGTAYLPTDTRNPSGHPPLHVSLPYGMSDPLPL